MTKYNPSIDTIFIHIPKTGGITIYESILELDRFFGWFLGIDNPSSKEDTSIRIANNKQSTMLGHIYYKTLIEEKYLNIDYFKKSFKFCFVRNPYDRLVSLYKYHRIQKNLNLNFHEFVKILYEEYKLKRIPSIGLYNIKTFNKDSKLYHPKIYGNQYNEMIRWIPRDIGFVGRFENFDNDLYSLIKILGANPKDFTIPKLNYTKSDNYLDYYTNRETIRYVSIIYRHDLRRFGYSFL